MQIPLDLLAINTNRFSGVSPIENTIKDELKLFEGRGVHPVRSLTIMNLNAVKNEICQLPSQFRKINSVGDLTG